MSNEIRIDKKLAERIDESRFRSIYWKINMPKESRYSGYFFQCSNYFCEETSEYISLLPGKSEYLYELIKEDREQGKRYSRPKLSFEELQEIFAEHSKRFYHEDLPYALAFLKLYANNGSITAGRVVSQYFAVGKYSDKWFYESDTRRRKIGSRGVTILKELSSSEVQEIKEKLERRDLLREKVSCGNYKLSLDCYHFEQLKEVLSKESFEKITEKISEINLVIEKDLKTIEAELETLDLFFGSFKGVRL